MAFARVCDRLNTRRSVSDLIGADAPSVASHALKSRFMPYLSTDVHVASWPTPWFNPEHVSHRSTFSAGSFDTTLGRFAGSTRIAPSRLSTSIASVIAV